MDLMAVFEAGLTAEAYTQLLDAKQRDLHALYERRVDLSNQNAAQVGASSLTRLLVITEPWCGDSLAIFPAIAKLCDHAEIPLRVVRRDEYPDLIDQYLTNGGRSIPIAIGLDEDGHELFYWGPRPAQAQAIFERHRAQLAAGQIEKVEIHKKIRAFYARDNGNAVICELLAKVEGPPNEQPV